MKKNISIFIAVLIAIIAVPVSASLLSPSGAAGGLMTPGLFFRSGILGNAIIATTQGDMLGDSNNYWTKGWFKDEVVSTSLGIGTTTPRSMLSVSAGVSATTTIDLGERTCFNVGNSANSSISFYFVGTTQVIENHRCL